MWQEFICSIFGKTFQENFSSKLLPSQLYRCTDIAPAMSIIGNLLKKKFRNDIQLLVDATSDYAILLCPYFTFM